MHTFSVITNKKGAMEINYKIPGKRIPAFHEWRADILNVWADRINITSVKTNIIQLRCCCPQWGSHSSIKSVSMCQ